jgi:hypothetical protein
VTGGGWKSASRARAALFAVLTWLASLGAAAPVTADEAQPDATIHIQANSVSAGVGFSWGKGTLEYQGETHTVTMDGLIVLAVGISSANATGRVYHLKSLDDFPGKYDAVRGASAIGEGGAGVVMRNEKGVEVRMVAENTGVTFTIGASAVKLGLER